MQVMKIEMQRAADVAVDVVERASEIRWQPSGGIGPFGGGEWLGAWSVGCDSAALSQPTTLL